MNDKAINNIISEIAKKEGTEVKEVRKEMEKAIMAGYLKSNEKWNTVFKKNTVPTPEEFITEIVKMMVLI